MIHVLNRRADSHPDFCEDAYYHTERDGWIIAAVFDGCSDGEKSHFASQLHAYFLRNVIDNTWTGMHQLLQRRDCSADETLNALCGLLTTKVQMSREAIGLTLLEQLSTAVITMYDTTNGYLITKFLGDGVLCVDGEYVRVDSGEANAPNYIAYIDDTPTREMFTDYPTFVRADAKNWAICTDGIDALRHPHKPLEECIANLVEDKGFLHTDIMLRRKLNILVKEGLELRDDLTIIRYDKSV